MAGAVSRCRAPAIPGQAFGWCHANARAGIGRTGTLGKLEARRTATGPPSPGRQVRLAFARGPVAATAIARKNGLKFTPAVASRLQHAIAEAASALVHHQSVRSRKAVEIVSIG
jgi:hypothetical protein